MRSKPFKDAFVNTAWFDFNLPGKLQKLSNLKINNLKRRVDKDFGTLLYVNHDVII